MITVKEYADSRNKSVQAVYKQLHREKNRTRLEGHLLKQNRMTYLDEEAIKILDESQNVSIVLNVRDNEINSRDELSEYKNRVESLIESNNQLRNQQDFLKNKIINLQDELKVKTEQMTSLLLENKEKTLLLEQKKDQAEEINQLKEQLDQEKKEQLNEIEMLKNELEKEKNKGFFARLFGK